jgi:hypothetical protein
MGANGEDTVSDVIHEEACASWLRARQTGKYEGEWTLTERIEEEQ